MPKPMIVLCLFLLMVLVSQYERKQHSVNYKIQGRPTIIPRKLKPHYMLSLSESQESVKEKIILSQEKDIQRLNELVRSLQEQLQMCMDMGKDAANETMFLSTGLPNGQERQRILED